MIQNQLVLKKIVCFLLLILPLGLIAQETDVYKNIGIKMAQINEALIAKDTATLAKILHKDLTLGHSNGWLETKSDLSNTLINEGVIYISIENSAPFTIHHATENLVTTRRNIDVKGIYNNTEFDVKLNVLEIWIYENNRWQLLSRQSVNRKE